MSLSTLVMQVCLLFSVDCTVAPKPATVKTGYEPKIYPMSAPKAYVDLILKYAKNPSREAAQTEQESSWNPKATSPYAKGLRQFTDSTGRWMARTACRRLGSYQPYNPVWSLRCGIIYQELLQKNNHYGNYCLNRKIAEQEYNGGSRVITELRRSKSNSLDKARKYCRRAKWACKENYNYPKQIARRQVKYIKLGGVYCP